MKHALLFTLELIFGLYSLTCFKGASGAATFLQKMLVTKINKYKNKTQDRQTETWL